MKVKGNVVENDNTIIDRWRRMEGWCACWDQNVEKVIDNRLSVNGYVIKEGKTTIVKDDIVELYVKY